MDLSIINTSGIESFAHQYQAFVNSHHNFINLEERIKVSKPYFKNVGYGNWYVYSKNYWKRHSCVIPHVLRLIIGHPFLHDKDCECHDKADQIEDLDLNKMYYDKDFEKNLFSKNSNKSIIAFKNGVYDLEK